MRQSRRKFLKIAAAVGGALALRVLPEGMLGVSTAAEGGSSAPGGAGGLAASTAASSAPAGPVPNPGKVVLIKTSQHRDGVLRALRLFGMPDVRGKSVVIKPNFNSADLFPASTHDETLRTLIERCKEGGAREITIADRSGMGDTARVIRDKGIDVMGREMGVGVVALENLPASEWRSRSFPGWNWQKGVIYPLLLERADVIIQTCCLKTHGFGGHFTMSLKNTVGMVGRRDADGYDFMRELHSSPLQRTLIAEINQLYQPAVVVLDGIQAFIDGGPARGTLAGPEVVLAGTDRVALDAVGVALLRMHGVVGATAQGRIFDQEQIRRAVALGLGISAPGAIEMVTDNDEGRAVIAAVRSELAKG